MNEWIDFLWMPYAHANLSNIILEVIAVLFGILSVIFSQRVNIWVYPTGIVSTTIYIYLTFITTLYGEMIINIYYTGIGFYGWYAWARKKNDAQPLHITFSKGKDYLQTAILFFMTILFTVIIYSIYGKLERGETWVDIFTTGVFFAGMYQMAMKKAESWISWFIGNIISVPLYFYKGLALTSVQFIIFTGLSIGGYFLWRKKAKEIFYFS